VLAFFFDRKIFAEEKLIMGNKILAINFYHFISGFIEF